MRPHKRSSMLEGDNVDIWELIYHECDKLLVKPVFRKIKSHIDAPQTHFRKASVRHILANETADTAAAIATEMYGQIRATHGQEIDENVRRLQRRMCRRIATIEKHIRSKKQKASNRKSCTSQPPPTSLAKGHTRRKYVAEDAGPNAQHAEREPIPTTSNIGFTKNALDTTQSTKPYPMYKAQALPPHQAMPTTNVAAFAQLWNQCHCFDKLSTGQKDPTSLQETFKRGRSSDQDPSHLKTIPEHRLPPPDIKQARQPTPMPGSNTTVNRWANVCEKARVQGTPRHFEDMVILQQTRANRYLANDDRRRQHQQNHR